MTPQALKVHADIQRLGEGPHGQRRRAGRRACSAAEEVRRGSAGEARRRSGQGADGWDEPEERGQAMEPPREPARKRAEQRARGRRRRKSNDIVDYRYISVAALVRLWDELLRGELSAIVEVCTLARATDELEAGVTLRLMSRCKGEATVRVPFEKRFFNVPEGLLRDKPRELWTINDVCEFHVTAFQGAFVSQARKCRFGDLVDGSINPTQICRMMLAAQRTAHAWPARRDREVTGRLWCVWELCGASKSRKTIEISFPPSEDDRLARLLDSSDGPEEITKAVAAVDLATAECHSDKDRDMIVGNVDAGRQPRRVQRWQQGRMLAQFEEVLALDTQQLGENHPEVAISQGPANACRTERKELKERLEFYLFGKGKRKPASPQTHGVAARAREQTANPGEDSGRQWGARGGTASARRVAREVGSREEEEEHRRMAVCKPQTVVLEWQKEGEAKKANLKVTRAFFRCLVAESKELSDHLREHGPASTLEEGLNWFRERVNSEDVDIKAVKEKMKGSGNLEQAESLLIGLHEKLFLNLQSSGTNIPEIGKVKKSFQDNLGELRKSISVPQMRANYEASTGWGSPGSQSSSSQGKSSDDDENHLDLVSHVRKLASNVDELREALQNGGTLSQDCREELGKATNHVVQILVGLKDELANLWKELLAVNLANGGEGDNGVDDDKRSPAHEDASLETVSPWVEKSNDSTHAKPQLNLPNPTVNPLEFPGIHKDRGASGNQWFVSRWVSSEIESAIEPQIQENPTTSGLDEGSRPDFEVAVGSVSVRQPLFGDSCEGLTIACIMSNISRRTSKFKLRRV
ncbi:Kinesin light chain [Durusdinium trenchii]|uniref:Kinesin light chain n=1 Tax=Durusdinium trenchii TaxID=1381693 RepID=A0ABP0RM66_9DINO